MPRADGGPWREQSFVRWPTNDRSWSEVVISRLPTRTMLRAEFRRILSTFCAVEIIDLSARSPTPVQCLILRNLTNALRLLVADLNRRDLVAVGDAARDLLTSGLDFL